MEAAAEAMAAASSCVIDNSRAEACRDSRAAAHLKLIAISAVFGTSVVGILGPVVLARLFQARPIYERMVHVIRSLVAGLILSGALVHVLPQASTALSDCHVSSFRPWREFPFSGAVTLAGALLALLVDVASPSHARRRGSRGAASITPYARIGTNEDPASVKLADLRAIESSGIEREEGVDLGKMKQRMISQLVEIGIVLYPLIVGLTVGMSQNRCIIAPLIVALVLHLIFEGAGLGALIAQAGFSFGTTSYGCFVFSVTTPLGIVLGMIVLWGTGYGENHPNALIADGILGSLSSGVLIYSTLVNIIAVDFFHNKMTESNKWLKNGSYVALLLGSTAMSVLALWA